MVKPNPSIVGSLLLVFIGFSQAEAAWVWTPQTRRWVHTKYAPKDTPQAQMEWALGFFEAGDYQRAAKEFLRLVAAYPKSQLAPQAQFLAGVCFEQLGRWPAAFTAYKRVIEIYPFSPQFQDAVERSFGLAERLFHGERLKLLGPIKVPALDKAIEIYELVVQHAPYGAYGDKAQLRLGQCFLRQRRYEEAQRAFQQVVDDYPHSPLAEEAKFHVAFCARQLSLKASYDQSATEEAIDWYRRFISEHPDSDLKPQAEESLSQLEEIKAKGLVDVARFYEKQGKISSATMYYHEVIRRYPNSASAAWAIARLKEMEEKGRIQR
jgi:outer membrane assembly lipoprotein YfiO